MKKILLIEDDQVMRENTAEILELANYEVLTAPNGKEGCKLAKETIPDLIVSDIMMPLLDGYGVLHVLSKDPLTASIPFIFLTAKAEKSEMRKGMELGADDYLTKPFEDTELLSAIEVRLKKSERVKKDYSQNDEGLESFLKDVSELPDLSELTNEKPTRVYKKKEVVYHAGDNPHYVYFLSSGKVKTFRTHDDGKEYITNMFSSGDFFGHIALFENTNHNDTAIILEESKVSKIPKEDFLALISKNRDVATKFIKMLSGNIVEKESQLLSLAYSTVRRRAAEALILLSKRFEQNKKGETSFSVTRDDLASLAGTATETLIRCLSEFKEDGLIEVKGRSITVIDLNGLENVQ